MADLYSPEQLVEMSGIMGTQDAQFAEPAMQLLKTEPARNFRIEVAADSLVEIDEQSEKTNRLEFLQAAGGFLQQAMPAAQQAPALAPLLAEMLLFGVRAFRASRPLEAAFDTAMAKLSQPQPPQPQQPDPEAIKAQAQMQVEQGRMQMEQSKLQMQSQIEQIRLQSQIQIEQMRAQNEQQLELLRQEAETAREKYKAELDARVRLAIANIDANVEIEVAEESRDPYENELHGD